MQYKVKVDSFEGPLDLLLHLIQRLEIDIYNIPMADITEQYLMFVHTMKELELDIASEYLVMAATLLAIKSKMLLPKQEEELMDDEMEVEEDPRDELVERLIEYRKYKEVARKLKEKEQERGKLYTKPPEDLSCYQENDESQPTELNVTIYDMLGAFNKLLRRKKFQKPLTTKIKKQEISIETRMSEIIHELTNMQSRTRFSQLFPYEDKEHIVVTFLAVLELMKRNEIEVEQDNNFAEILLSAKKGE
ncbi:segregation and condensation protein A [Oikeobacillus pervagus]|uniref:Segregation and condensation protein A n=1 Tax=Oikeobacillus pervagus TaxID=1325931 RepID=A0AAJ1SVR5_9BACI|nr:segregation/condensation protein A [Oikeobacillus pervagus]MDQ0213745.1 segregation and condensation protein A [Oikeobacillus pervagus]